MQKSPVNNTMRIDLSDKSPDEVAQYLQALLSIRYTFHKRGLKLKIERRPRPAKVKIKPV